MGGGVAVCLFAAAEDNLSKALVYYSFPVFRRIGEYTSLDLFNSVMIFNVKKTIR